MREQETQKKANGELKMSLSQKIWGGIGCLSLMAALGAGLYVYNALPVDNWREGGIAFPWKGENVSIDSMQACWKSSVGDARMELRSHCYPEITLQLGEGSGKGHLVLEVLNSRGNQQGDTVYLPYNAGTFESRESNNIKTEGKNATVRIETGYATGDDYLLHQLNTEEPLWRVEISYRNEGSAELHHMGFTCIPANEL